MLRRLLPWLPVVVVVLLAVLASGVVHGSGGAPDGVVPARPDPPSAAPVALSVAQAIRLVRHTSLTRRDLPGRFSPVSAGGGRPTLCGVDAAGTGLLLARHQVRFSHAGTRTRRVVVEVLAYRHGGAERALDALREAAPRCTRAVVPGPIEQPGTLALHVRARRPAAGREVVLERRGDVLVLLQVDGPPRPLTLDLARAQSRRLLDPGSGTAP